MTEGEKMIWAATYAAAFLKTYENRDSLGTKPYVPGCIEWACAAVLEARESRPAVVTGWGGGSVEVAMLEEMVE